MADQKRVLTELSQKFRHIPEKNSVIFQQVSSCEESRKISASNSENDVSAMKLISLKLLELLKELPDKKGVLLQIFGKNFSASVTK